MRAQGKDPLPPDSTWTLATAGDAIITRQLECYENDPAFMALVKPIRAADAAALNLEINLFRLLDFKGYPQAENGGAYEIGPPEAAPSLKWVGFRLINMANNHTTDWGIEAMLETTHLLDSLNMVHGGTGMSAGEAAMARYLETPRGRFALIGMATAPSVGASAAARETGVGARPTHPTPRRRSDRPPTYPGRRRRLDRGGRRRVPARLPHSRRPRRVLRGCAPDLPRSTTR